ncbi:DUF3604 domain-containing protein [Seongchinamella unica]|uniref:DUF3604 domain-containing protein n=1 Tax=Seongchinamella unica TaxID=2547392 RepID=A0A4R5LVI0_9GAMM|nr:DUF3604 domain-containing protein [Seongchinamella unica]TDG15449.1 DUF3604 domain-containing protein [Seongchinamella unica]
MKKLTAALAALSLTVLSGTGSAQAPAPDKDSLAAAWPSQTQFSPYAGRNFPGQVFWGDTHLHTAMSFDAGAFGARLSPEDAYRFARGEEVTSSGGLKVKLSRPLDFLVVADHSDNMGFFPTLLGGEPSYLANPTGKRWYQMIQTGGSTAVDAALEIIGAFSDGSFPQEIASVPGTPTYQSAWDIAIEAADKANTPGEFTAFIGYEWTSNENGANLHRVVMYRDGGDVASRSLPYTTLAPAGSPNPVDLWRELQRVHDNTGANLLAIAHNGNLSNGIMFPLVDSFTGRKIDRDYARTRMKWEPLYEITQIKGDGEAHPFLSPNDEFADYETWDMGNLTLTEAKTDDMLQYEYGRSGLKLGLQAADRLGVNPYQVGFIGSTDSHTALATAAEENFFGKHAGTEPTVERMTHPVGCFGEKCIFGWEQAASGLAAVWSTENTRGAIFDAMKRRETYATTGSRMLVRFFGGWEFDEGDTLSRTPGHAGYTKGVPMGSELKGAKGNTPSFLVAARKDPFSGNLDRIQIVKGWLDKKGKPQEKIYDVAWAGDRTPSADGKLPPVGNTVDVANATWTNTIGDPELISVWRDPDFDPNQRAFYYARVLEIPTPRWTAYEKLRFPGAEVPEGVPMVHQERAYTSAIWYTP